MNCTWVSLKNASPPCLSVNTCNKTSFTQLEIILGYYVAMILQIKDSLSTKLTFTAHNYQN